MFWDFLKKLYHKAEKFLFKLKVDTKQLQLFVMVFVHNSNSITSHAELSPCETLLTHSYKQLSVIDYILTDFAIVGR